MLKWLVTGKDVKIRREEVGNKKAGVTDDPLAVISDKINSKIYNVSRYKLSHLWIVKTKTFIKLTNHEGLNENLLYRSHQLKKMAKLSMLSILAFDTWNDYLIMMN